MDSWIHTVGILKTRFLGRKLKRDFADVVLFTVPTCSSIHILKKEKGKK
jgi:hypothetical protein